MSCTATDLQREFKLSPAMAKEIISEQTELAMRHYRYWFLIFAFAFAAAFIAENVLQTPWAKEVGKVWPLPLLASVIAQYLARRRAQSLIRAEAERIAARYG